MAELSTKRRKSIDSDAFAFPKERKEPLNDAAHVRSAIARFDQVEGVSDRERAGAFRRIKDAAKLHDVEMEAKTWHDLMGKGKSS